MRLGRVLPLQGYVVWLTPEQGGRSSGPPATPSTDDYAATAFVPPSTDRSGLASFVLRVADRRAWVSAAEAGWLVDQDEARFDVQPGSVMVVTEGSKVVAYFHVESVQEGVRSRSAQAH
jgi:hypothetical protein